MPGADVGLRYEQARLVFAGELVRPAIAGLWPQLPPADVRIDVLDLRAVPRIDSAGLALLARLCRRHPQAVIEGDPAGLADLRDAYRLDDHLACAA